MFPRQQHFAVQRLVDGVELPRRETQEEGLKFDKVAKDPEDQLRRERSEARGLVRLCH